MASSIERDELAAWLRLALSPGVGNTSARRLLAAFGSPQSVFSQSIQSLGHIVSAAQAEALQTEPDDWAAQLDATWRWLGAGDESGAARHVAVLGDALYPAPLLASEDPPLMLFMLGRVDLLARAGVFDRAIAVVGSRNPTPQGASNAREFSRSLAASGFSIVSGLALGVDGAAHDGALLGAAPDALATVAVVGTGLDRVYPARHRELAHRIATRGVIMSEFLLGTPPLNPNFPRRNRIIAGLSLGTLVVEAALRSGSLITARLAVELGKEVFAIPGSIHSPQSRGCHALIRQGAKLVESAEDVLEELRLPGTPTRAAADGDDACYNDDMPSADNPLLDAMGHDPVSLDALIARTGIDAATLQAKLLDLELDGAVARLPGGLFQRLVRA